MNREGVYFVSCSYSSVLIEEKCVLFPVSSMSIERVLTGHLLAVGLYPQYRSGRTEVPVCKLVVRWIHTLDVGSAVGTSETQ